jgi:spermidine/putrescine-binding protein
MPFFRHAFGLFLVTLGGLLALGCSSKPAQPTLNVLNWSDYIDPALRDEFQKQAGCRLQYDNFSTDTELETKLQTGGGYDVVFPSDRSMGPLLKRGQLQELDKSKLTNLKHLDPQFLDPPFDKGNRYSVPYFWGTVAVGVRTDHVKEAVSGFEVLFDERYKGKITMLEDAEHVVAVALLHLGLPMNSTDEGYLAQAKNLLVRQKPLVQAYLSDGYREKLVKGEAWVALGWSGDLLQARRDEPKVRVIVPAAGTLVWNDSLAIPKGAKNVELAHQFINYLLDPDVAARNANFVRYPSPNLTARTRVSPDLLSDPSVYLPKDLLDRCQRLTDRGADVKKVHDVWREVRK